MALLNCRTILLPKQNIPLTMNQSKYLILVLLITLALPAKSSKSSEPQASPWPHLNVDSQIDNIITDEKDGSVFIVSNADIYKYTHQLELSTRTEISTSDKANSAYTGLAANETTAARRRSDILNKLLLIVKKFNPNLLLACSQSSDLLFQCLLHKTNELKSAIPLGWLDNNGTRRIKIQPNEQLLVLNILDETNDLLLIANQATDPGNTSNLPSISRLEITKSNTGTKQLFFQQKSMLQYQNYESYQYMYLFNHNHHTHLILNDLTHHNVKLARICNNDTDLTSYTEISLPCGDPDRDIMRAKAAYLDPAHEEPTLYVVFESLTTDQTTFGFGKKQQEEKSFLCSYSMKLIEDIYTRVISDCHRGHQSTNLLRKFHPSSSPPPCQRNPISSEDWCKTKTNPYIDGTSQRYNFKEDTYIDLDGVGRVNFIYTSKQGQDKKVILFVGTETGQLTKIGLDEELFYTIDLNNRQVKSYQTGDKLKSKHALAQSISDNNPYASTKFTANSNLIYAVSNSSRIVNQLNIDACYYYQSCRACLETPDPLECDWCGGTCSRRTECEKRNQTSQLSCPPIIVDFNPKSGPLSGSTKLRIKGDNFGTSKGFLKVRLNDQECLLLESKETFIECLTKPVVSPQNTTINIYVLDESTPIYSNGTAYSKLTFNYVTVRGFGLIVHPDEQKNSNRREIEVYGQNLNAGSNLRVMIGGTECELLELEENKVRCSLKQAPASSEAASLRIIVDGTDQVIDPKLYKGNLNLLTKFLFREETQAPKGSESTTMVTTAENLQDIHSNSYYSIFIILASLFLISLVIIYIVRSNNFPKLNLKLGVKNGDKLDEAKVSFRNPQSHKFSQSQFNVNTDTMSGLVKLNGSVMSSGYFTKPSPLNEQFEQDQPLMNSFIDNEMMSVLLQEKILIDRGRLTLGHVLGSGQFGRVYKGFLRIEETGEHAAVAVKTLYNRSTWEDGPDKKAFLEEGLMMKDFEHDNVLALIGVTFDSSGLPMVITPFMLYGDLRSYISDEASTPTVKELIDFGTQVARGMAYLSNLKFVHRDLAARNCMLDDNLVVKVADFGLSRDIYERDYYSSDATKKTKLPVKWMAIESLEKCIYNTKTDVWSYGVLLWELMTRGVIPYPDVDNFDLFSYLKEGRRMLRPRYCPLILYKIMLSCWDEDPQKRPTFDELVKRVSDVITQLKIAKDGQQKVSRDVTYCDVLK